MKIIASTTSGFLIEATEYEVTAILTAVSKKPTKENTIKIGDNIPAYDYAAMITRCKDFANSYSFKEYKNYIERVSREGNVICEGIETLKYED